ncbi:MAG: hypothetical protein QM703_13635 [Gemmatales bacterium]
MPDPRLKKWLSTGTKLYESIDFELMSDGYRESLQDGQPMMQMRARVPWNSRRQFQVNMLGSHMTSGSRASGISRYVPFEHPGTYWKTRIETPFDDTLDADAPFLGFWCSGVELTGVSDELSIQDQITGELMASATQPLQWVDGTDYSSADGVVTGAEGYAECDLTFSPQLYEIRSDEQMDLLPAPLCNCELSRYLIREARFGGNQFTIQKGGLFWRDLANTPNLAQSNIPDSYLKPFPEANLIYTIKYSPGINWEAINNCFGKCNAPEVGPGAPGGQFDYQPDWQGFSWGLSATAGYSPGDLLFLGTSEIRPMITAAGQQLFDISLAFSYRPSQRDKTGASVGGQQGIYRVTTDSFERVVRASGTSGSGQAAPPANPANWKDLVDSALFSSLFTL